MDERESIRKLLGQTGDVKPQLVEMFGGAYLDHREDHDNVPDELLAFAEGLAISDGSESEVFKVNGLIERAIARDEVVVCQDSQRLMIEHLDSLTSGTLDISFDDAWKVLKHMYTCSDPICHKLFDVFKMDK